MIRGLAPALALMLSAPALPSAHPHSYVDQQVQLSIGTEAVVAAIVIVPSAPDGADIQTRLDGDGNGQVSQAEADTFGAALLAQSALALDGRALTLGLDDVTVSRADEIVAGTGRITLRALADLPTLAPGAHEISFTIGFDAFSSDWFVQPFYDPALFGPGDVPEIERGSDGGAVVIRFRVPG